MKLVLAASRKLAAVAVVGSRQVLKRTVTLAPTKTPVAPFGGSSCTTERLAACGSAQVTPGGAAALPDPPQPASAAARSRQPPASGSVRARDAERGGERGARAMPSSSWG